MLQWYFSKTGNVSKFIKEFSVKFLPNPRLHLSNFHTAGLGALIWGFYGSRTRLSRDTQLALSVYSFGLATGILA